MNVTTAVALALFLGQAQPDGSTPAARPAAVVPADATGPVITLDEALQVAGERNLNLKALSAQLNQAGEITWKALSLYLPQVTVGASYTRQDEVHLPLAIPAGNPDASGAFSTFYLDPVEFQRKDLLGVQANATQTLFSARLYFAIRGAKESQHAAVKSLENGRRQVLFGVARAYYAAASLKEALGVTGRLLEDRPAPGKGRAGALPGRRHRQGGLHPGPD